MLTGKYLELYNRLKNFIPNSRLIHDELRKLTFGTDASFYRLIPQLVVKVQNEKEVVELLKLCSELELPVTFRAAGTSLSGQSISDSVLAVLGENWNKYKIFDDATKISLQPGILGSRANQFLAPYKKKIGPDPASINAAKIGGIAANNASGMCCGTAQNSYKTLESMKIILNDGTFVDTSDEESIKEFHYKKPELINKIKSVVARIRNNQVLFERIKQKYKMKNTTGYSLNAFVDFIDPIDIIQHLMIGSEGTLGFISEITYRTVPELADKASSLIIFPDIETACKAVFILKNCPVEAVELMDRASLRSVEDQKGMPSYLKDLDEKAAALLVETRGINKDKLLEQIDFISNEVTILPLVRPITFTDKPIEYAKLWNIRKGLFPSVGAMRKTGTTCIIEDVAFPIPRLAEATLELQSMFKKHGYNDAIIFGHALEGNLHFVFNQDFNSEEEVLRYKAFIDEVTQMVVKKYDGSLKAEHGTGRNMAPFVELEWGTEAYLLMKEIKSIFDSKNLLNPGVIINLDKSAHLKNLKPLPEANEIIDKCIECGFCESHCPSQNLTITPRHRIVAYREISRLKSSNSELSRLHELESDYRYFGDETCATDGLCALACPVKIDTGKMIKELRAKNNSDFANSVAWFLSKHFAGTTTAIRALLKVVDDFHSLLGSKNMESISSIFRTISNNKIPKWNKYLPKNNHVVEPRDIERANPLKVVYFPACLNRTMGISKDYDTKESLTDKTIHLLQKAGFEVLFPDNLNNLCCGMSFASKGFFDQADALAKELEHALLKASNDGEYPVYVDMSPCLLRMKETLVSKLKLYEPIDFILEFLVDKLKFTKSQKSVAIHTTCSSIKMGLNEKFKTIAELCAEEVVVPENIECCGWAGDRGFTFPELNNSALESLKSQVSEKCSHGYSTSRTCEIGLSLNSGISYKSIVYLVDDSTKRKN